MKETIILTQRDSSKTITLENVELYAMPKVVNYKGFTYAFAMSPFVYELVHALNFEAPVTVAEKAAEAPKNPVAGLTPGRVVHFVNDESREVYCKPYGLLRINIGEHFAATVTRVTPPTAGSPMGLAFLSVLTPGEDLPVAKNEVAYSEEHLPGTWHWPERAE